MHIDRKKLDVELTRLGLRQLDLAREMNVPVTTLGSWLRGAHPGPDDLNQQIQAAIKRLQPARRG